MHGKFGMLPRGKRATTVRRHPACSFSRLQCFRVSIPPAVRPTLLRQMDMGSLARTTFVACRTREYGEGGQAQTVLTESVTPASRMGPKRHTALCRFPELLGLFAKGYPDRTSVVDCRASKIICLFENCCWPLS